ncbi:MAG: murein transglycosylase domain-containing protein [Candidatus Lightella neohaematopini]|nr:murein transglycosylase domain-containing protein [Candidatus Lightella neohaematopini]MCV2531185.1 murein transglycosylase domain-containing protein [Candidatus Lightella neohaematopini]
MKKILYLLSTICLLISCSSKNNLNRSIFYHKKNNFGILIVKLTNNIKYHIHNHIITSIENYLEYSKYKTYSYINLNNHSITIETIVSNNPIQYLRNATINSILIYNYLSLIKINKHNFNIQIFRLKYNIINNLHLPVRYYYYAAKLTDYLLQTKLIIKQINQHKIWSITIKYNNNKGKNIYEKAYKYLNLVNKASKKYGVDRSLILAIIKIESNFNPYAVSHSNALGLMQIIRQSAGRDVFKKQGKLGQPSRKYLLNPRNNIDIGTAYLAILQNKYLNKINNPLSRRYAVITAYHSGASSVLKVFSQNQNRAIKIINNLSPKDVYLALNTKHPSLESRSYLSKVNQLQQEYQK